MGGFPLKPLYLLRETIEALRTRPPPKHPTQVRRGLVNANFHEHGHTLHSLTSLGIGFSSTGRKSPPQLCQPVFQWGEISPLSRVSDNPSYPVISGHLYRFLTPFITGSCSRPCNDSTKLPIARDPGSPFENGFMEPKDDLRFGGDEGHPKSSSENMTIDS